MSLDGLRDAYIREKKNEIASCEQSRKRKLRELYHVNALLQAGPLPADQRSFAFTSEPSERERRFLDANDITKGRRFDDSSLPYPFQLAPLPSSLPFQSPAKAAFPAFPSQQKSLPSPVPNAAASLHDQLRAASASPSVVATPPLPRAQTPVVDPVQDDAPPVQESFVSPRGDSTPSPTPGVAAPVVEEEQVDQPALERSIEQDEPIAAQPSKAPEPQEEEIRTEAPPDGPSADPQLVVPPTAEDDVVLPDAPPPAATVRDRPKRPRVIHLPPQEVQEARLKETEQRLARAREQEAKEVERLAIPIGTALADAISSPASTVGPYSQATPYATHNSPDTSPDRESFVDAATTQVETTVELDAAAQQAKDEHEQALQRQMQEARERARGDDEPSPTPEVERQLEEEQAIRLARDGKSRLSEAEPTAVSHSLTEHAEDVAREVVQQTVDAQQEKLSREPAADSFPTPTTTVPEPSSLERDNAEDTAVAQEAAPNGTEHPTPPADVDVEMRDAPPAVQEQGPVPPQQQSPPLRMTTRVSSGAMRKKSVSEIIAENSTSKAMLTPRSSNISAMSASPARPRSRDQKRNEVATVVFAKQDAHKSSKALQLYSDDYASLQGASESDRDYLEGLFNFQAHHLPRSIPLTELVASARKTMSTAGMLATLREAQDYKILKRVYQLQNANRWSLRQLVKSAEPRRPTSHQDHLLKEMKWLHTDFKEERKWKQALAATFAEWCAEFVNSGPEEQAALRVKRRIPSHARRLSTGEEDMSDAPTPGLDHSGANETESESFADDEELSPFVTNPPLGLFSLGFNDVVWKLDRTPASDAMLQELPMYEPNLEKASDVSALSFCDPPILPVSKFITGKLVSKVRGPPRKRSRFEYESEEEPSSPPSRSDTSAEHSMPSTPGRRLFHRNDLPPEMTDVALFNPENKHVRDRLHAAHSFKPPTEFPMPSVSFFENRTSSQWLWEEDQKLRTLVKDYTFNWSLVAQQLALPSMFTSGSGRRTPWECFERWVQLEGLPSEMSKTQYFRTYQTRLEQAQRTVIAQHQAQQQILQQQSQQGQNVSGQQRRRTTQPIRVERRRDNRHLAIIDSMRKLARKREAIAHKQAESQKAAALRKAQEPPAPQSKVHTPQEFSRLKWEREEKMKLKLQQQNEIAMRQQAMVAAQRQANMQGAMQGLPGQPAMPNGANVQQRNGVPANNGNVPTQMANPASQAMHPGANPNMTPRQHPGQQGMQTGFPNGNMAGVAMGNPGVPQAQMQANMQGSQRMAPPDQMRQRSQYPATNQHQFQFQQQQINMASNLTASMNMGNGMPTPNMMASMAGQGINGNMSSPMNGALNNAGSPRMNQVNPQMQSPARPLSSGHMPHLLQIQNNLKNQHPDWSPDQLQKAASEQLTRLLAKQRAAAMNAATGSASASPQIGNNVYLQGGGMQSSSPPGTVQNYQQQLLRTQSMMAQQRQQAGSPGMSAPPMSRSATPQNPQQMGMQSPGAPQARS